MKRVLAIVALYAAAFGFLGLCYLLGAVWHPVAGTALTIVGILYVTAISLDDDKIDQ